MIKFFKPFNKTKTDVWWSCYLDILWFSRYYLFNHCLNQAWMFKCKRFTKFKKTFLHWNLVYFSWAKKCKKVTTTLQQNMYKDRKNKTFPQKICHSAVIWLIVWKKPYFLPYQLCFCRRAAPHSRTSGRNSQFGATNLSKSARTRAQRGCFPARALARKSSAHLAASQENFWEAQQRVPEREINRSPHVSRGRVRAQ